jgi:hypothetical protein
VIRAQRVVWRALAAPKQWDHILTHATPLESFRPVIGSLMRHRRRIVVCALLVGCGSRPQPTPMPVAVLTDAEVEIEVDRVRTLALFGHQCVRGTLGCDGMLTTAPDASSAAPLGAAGFDFSMTLDDAEKRCRAGGQMWTSMTRDSFACSGSVGVSLPFHVDLVTCRSHLCRLVLSQHVAHGPVERFGEVEAELARSYGPGRFREVEVPPDCNAPEALGPCIHEGRAHVRAAWKWDSGYAVTATLEAPTPKQLFLFLAYSSPTFGETLRARGL